MATRTLGVLVVGAVAVFGLAGCSADEPDDGGPSETPTLTYWATNQAATIADDERILQPELDKFEQETGIKVELEVVGWNDLQTRILTAATSGSVPDVTNLGNTWAPTLQGTDAFVPWDDDALAKVGGMERFLESALASGGSSDSSVPSQTLPLYAGTSALYYNKAMFANAGISAPPKTWTEFAEISKELSAANEGVYGFGYSAGQPGTNMNMMYILAAQHGAAFYDGEDPTFATPEMADAVDQLVGFVRDGIAIPSSVEWTEEGSPFQPFANGEIAMMISRPAGASLESFGMTEDDYGVATTPVPSSLLAGAVAAQSHVGG